MAARRHGQPASDDPAAALPPALANLEESDEDPALYWGPDWKEQLEEARAEAAEGQGDTYYSAEEFLMALENDMNAPR